ncbi:hypothetical protein EV424DRAFT_1538583 [Suillus variegatus]|nr:hypothetical protein EV424DRAFT_1538583 [Suillus variegatus]
MRDTMINTALQAAKTELFGQSTVKKLKGIHDYMVSSLANMRRGFKAHAMNIVHLGYNLRQPLFSPVDDISHRESEVPELLKDLRFLHSFEKTADNQEIKRPLEHPVLINMIIDVLVAGLSKVLNGQMDRLFGVCVLRSYSRRIGSEGLRPQLVRCAPFPSTVPYFKVLTITRPKVRTGLVVYLDVFRISETRIRLIRTYPN